MKRKMYYLRHLCFPAKYPEKRVMPVWAYPYMNLLVLSGQQGCLIYYDNHTLFSDK
ncbi:MAG TPA: hypothetical protein PK304_03610 [Mobilitalea sp.]|nr:hypothetical protein [Mobilitalea sp.]